MYIYNIYNIQYIVYIIYMYVYIHTYICIYIVYIHISNMYFRKTVRKQWQNPKLSTGIIGLEIVNGMGAPRLLINTVLEQLYK